MANTSFSSGFSAGVAMRHGRFQNRLAKQEQRRLLDQQIADQISEQLKQGREGTEEAIKHITDGLSQAIKNGASMDDPNVQQSAALIMKLLDVQAQTGQAFVSAAIEQGFDPELAANVFSNDRFVQNQLALVSGALQVSGLNTVERSGAAEGRGKLSGAEAILDRPLSGDERQRLAGVAPPRSLVTIGNTQETAFEKKLGEDEGAIVQVAREQGHRASDQLVEIGRIKAALQSGQFETGTFADSRVFLGRLFEFMGVQPPTDIIGDAATADTLDAASNRLGIEIAQDMSRITNFSLAFVQNSLPQLTRTVQGNVILTDVMERMALRKLQNMQIANVFAKHGGLQPDLEGPISAQVTVDGKPVTITGESYWEMRAELDKVDPVLSDELITKIQEGSKGAPTSFKYFGDPFRPFRGDLPAGIPIGSKHIGTKPGGIEVYRLPDGSLKGVSPEEQEDGGTP